MKGFCVFPFIIDEATVTRNHIIKKTENNQRKKRKLPV